MPFVTTTCIDVVEGLIISLQWMRAQIVPRTSAAKTKSALGGGFAGWEHYSAQMSSSRCIAVLKTVVLTRHSVCLRATESILACRQIPRVISVPEVPSWQPRGHSFYTYLKQDHPKKYSGKGVHWCLTFPETTVCRRIWLLISQSHNKISP